MIDKSAIANADTIQLTHTIFTSHAIIDEKNILVKIHTTACRVKMGTKSVSKKDAMHKQKAFISLLRDLCNFHLRGESHGGHIAIFLHTFLQFNHLFIHNLDLLVILQLNLVTALFLLLGPQNIDQQHDAEQ